jgi:hypothetical protein
VEIAGAAAWLTPKNRNTTAVAAHVNASQSVRWQDTEFFVGTDIRIGELNVLFFR